MLPHVQILKSIAHLIYNCKVCNRNCTYSYYTEAAATCSAAQQHNTFPLQILYKLCNMQMNCSYSNYNEAAATHSNTQEHRIFTVQILYSPTLCNWTVLTVITQKLLLHVQLHNNTAHLLYNYCTKSTVCKRSLLTVITQ